MDGVGPMSSSTPPVTPGRKVVAQNRTERIQLPNPIAAAKPRQQARMDAIGRRSGIFTVCGI